MVATEVGDTTSQTDAVTSSSLVVAAVAVLVLVLLAFDPVLADAHTRWLVISVCASFATLLVLFLSVLLTRFDNAI